MKKWFLPVVTFILFVALGLSLWWLYDNLPGEEVSFIPVSQPEKETIVDFSNSEQFYQNMRFPDRLISYEIFNDCTEKKKSQVVDGLREIESKTIIRFYPTNQNPQVSITCSEIAPDPSSEDHFVAGEGGPTEIINSSFYSIILKGKISLFREDSCPEPKIAVHEMLHVLGFDHNNNPNSILNPTLNCNQKIDDYLIKSINELYSKDSLPDLSFGKIEASRAGRYLNFEVNMINRGLSNAEGVVLGVYSDGELVKEFTIDGGIDIGTSKKLTVENLRVSKNDEIIKFVLDKDNKVNEIFEDNNEAELKIMS